MQHHLVRRSYDAVSGQYADRPAGRLLVAFHAGSEVRHQSEWWGRAVDLDFRFFPPAEIAEAVERAGMRVEMRLERVSYPGELVDAVRSGFS